MEEEELSNSKVKLEIDIAEEPPEHWMTDQPPQGQDRTRNMSNSRKRKTTDGVVVKIEVETDVEEETPEVKATPPSHTSSSCYETDEEEKSVSKKRHVCKECGEAFVSTSLLKQHMVAHNGEKHLACDICNKAFSRPDRLNSHMLTHKGQKHLACDLCNREFTKSGELKRHKSFQKNFVCDVCGKAFTKCTNLIRQQLVHLYPKYSVCDGCTKELSLSNSLEVGEHQTSRPVLKRFSALEDVEEVVYDQDSDDEDFDLLNDNYSEEDEMDFNQHHPLLSEFVGADCETENDSQYDLDAAEDLDAFPSISFAPHPDMRGHGRGGCSARGTGQRRSSRGRGRGIGGGTQESNLITEWRVADAQAPNADVAFTGNPGIKCNVDNFKPVDYMELFFDHDLIDRLVVQTNLYASQFTETQPDLSQNGTENEWEDVDSGEMKKFLALVLLMGVVRLPSVELYWSKKVLYRIPVFSKVMARNRFQIILQFLHFQDNSKMPAQDDPQHYDRLYKIRPILDHLNVKFQEVYEPRQAVCVDESVLLWRGKLVFRQHVPLKCAKFGIKLFQCCESDGSVKGSGGYCYRFTVHAGNEDPVTKVQDVLEAAGVANSNMSASENMALFLIAPLLNKGYHVYTNRLHTSLRLFMYLLEKKTLACGAVRGEWGFPFELHGVQPNPGSSAAWCGDGKIVATKYNSRKLVHLLSTVHGHTEEPVPNKRLKEGVDMRPEVSASYRRNMSGVDREGDLLHPFDCSRRFMKWTKKLFFHFFQVAACNAFILSKSGDHPSKSFLSFLESVTTSWLWPDCVPVVEEDGTDDEVRLTARHFIFPIPPTPGKARAQKACKVCQKKKIRRDVRFYCQFCPSKPALCYPQCFMDYHTKTIYWQ